MRASADILTTFTVTTTADSGAGSMRQAITDANALPSGSSFIIAIDVTGTLTTLTPETLLDLAVKTCWIHGRLSAVITGFSCEIDGGRLTLQNVNIENSDYYNLPAIKVASGSSENMLLLSGSNHLNGLRESDSNLDLEGKLMIDKVPGGSDTDSMLALTGTWFGVLGTEVLTIRGGTLDSRGVH